MEIGSDNVEPAEVSGPGLTRREQFFEVLVFLFLIVPSIALSLFTYAQDGVPFTLVATSAIFRDLALVALILFFLWRNGEPVSLIGLTLNRVWSNIGLGVLLFVPFTISAGLLETILRAIGLSSPPTGLPSYLTPNGTAQLVLAFILVVVVAFAEEIIFRGYLIRRFANVMGNLAAAIVLSSVIFSLGHGYEGGVGIVTTGFMGAIFAVIYVWRKSLVTPIVLHFIQDFIGLIIIPLSGINQ